MTVRGKNPQQGSKPATSAKSKFSGKRPATDPLILEKALHESKARFAELVEQLPITVFEMNQYGKIVFANPHGLESFGYDREDLELGLTLPELIIPEDHPEALKKLGRALQGEKLQATEYTALRKDGSTFPISVVSNPIIMDEEIVGIRGVAMDLTERKQLEKECRTHEKMEIIGTLAGAIVHQFSNLLIPILASFSLVNLIIGEEQHISEKSREEISNTLNDGERAARRLMSLNKKLLSLSHGRSLSKEITPLGEVIIENTKLALVGSNICPLFMFSGDGMYSNIDRAQIGEVVTNIVTNARHAMPKGGAIKITAKELQISDDLHLQPGTYTCISFKDEGTGIPADTLQHIFEPYFTTKGEYGSGLGLPVSLSIAKKHGGHISIDSNFGDGTVVRLYLPLSDRPIQSGRVVKGTTTTRKNIQILLMDDETAVLRMAERILDRSGYGVVCVEDGEKAFNAFKEARDNGTPFDLVILDLTVPGGKGGVWTIERLRGMDPDVKAIISSGYTEAEFPENVPRLPKPYNVSEMIQMVEKIIGN